MWLLQKKINLPKYVNIPILKWLFIIKWLFFLGGECARRTSNFIWAHNWTEEQSNKVAFQSELLKSDEHKLLTLDGCDLYVRDLKTLSGTSWLNDKVSV